MAVGKEIRSKIKSVENTKKITKAMEMVAASKMRKAQERMRQARPYSDKVRNIAANLSQANPEYQSPYMRTTGDAIAVGFIVVTTDKGLCGGLNTNILRAVTTKMREAKDAGKAIKVVAIGNKGFGFMNRINADVLSHAVQLGDKPLLDKLIGPVKVMLDQFVEGKLDAVYLCYTDYIYEPDAASVIDELLKRYLEALVYQGVADNMASEQSARMVAMKSATDNAGNLIAELKLIYNKTRQAAITKELSEIVGGAAAV